MQYMLLIYDNEAKFEETFPTEAEQQGVMGQWFQFTEELKATGKMIAGEALNPVATAKSVRVRDGKTVTTDGPFAETKEQLGGYYIVDVDTVEEAIAWAAKIPSAPYGTVEVRPVMTFE